MTWFTAIVAADRLAALLAKVRAAGGTVTSCRPQPDGLHLTWTTPSGPAGSGSLGSRAGT